MVTLSNIRINLNENENVVNVMANFYLNANNLQINGTITLTEEEYEQNKEISQLRDLVKIRVLERFDANVTN